MNTEQDPIKPEIKPLNDGIYRPELLSRRGEWIAWGLALVVWISMLALLLRGIDVILAMPIVGILLILAALSISLGNWMDRKTFLTFDTDSIAFRNGLRNVSLNWQDIREVRVLPSRWGKKVQVVGENSYFEFRTLGKVNVQGEEKGSVGFAEGDKILHTIVQNSQLEKTKKKENGELYSRP